MKFNNILIAGCGNLGSQLANLFIYKFIDEIKYNDAVGLAHRDINLYLVDPDLLRPNNFPYAFMSNSIFNQYIDYPKVFSLNEHFHNLIEDYHSISVVPIAEKYDESHIKEIDNTLCIDCRDISEQSSEFKIKAFSDGPFSRIIINPSIKKGKKNKYLFYASAFNAMVAATNVLKYIDVDFSKFKQDHNMIYDHKDNKFYGDDINGI